MLKYVLMNIVWLSFYVANAQNEPPKYRLKKITLFWGEAKSLDELKKDTAQKQTYWIEYEKNRIKKITLKRNFINRFNPNYEEQFTFQDIDNQLIIYKNKDTLKLIKFNEKKQAIEIKEYKQRTLLNYDEKGRLKTSRLDDSTNTTTFFYENNEVKSITDEGLYLSKDLKTYDNFKSPFYQRFELIVIRQMDVFFLHNCLAVYNIIAGGADILKTEYEYTYNSQNLPVEVIATSKYFSKNILTYQSRTLLEYE